MVSDLQSLFSNMANNSKRSAIREILKLTQQPEIISFAGGLPAPESFPIDDLKEIINLVQKKIIKPVIDSVYPLKKLPEALQRLKNKDAFGKILIKVQ